MSPCGRPQKPTGDRAVSDAGPSAQRPLCQPRPDASAHPHLSSPSKMEKRSIFLDRSRQYANSDEEDGYESPDVKRRGASVDDFLKGSELGKLVSVRHAAGAAPLVTACSGLERSGPSIPEKDGLSVPAPSGLGVEPGRVLPLASQLLTMWTLRP